MVAVVGAAVALTACGPSDSVPLARQACQYVDHSLALYHQSQQTSDPAAVQRLQQKAYIQLRFALPIAAKAAADDGLWQALMTSLSETNRVPEDKLLSSLREQCDVAERPDPLQPLPPSSVPPPPPPSATSSGSR